MFAQRKVLFSVDRKGKAVWFLAQNLCGAVPLMYVAIDNQCLANQTFMPQRQNGDGSIIEDTKPLACISHRMMRSARQIDRYLFSEGGSCGGQRRTAASSRAFDHFLRPGKADAF